MLGIIGGTGFGELAGLQDVSAESTLTPYGPAWVEMGWLHGEPVLFIPRHGRPPNQPPHRINYRANIHALHASGVDRIIAVTAVGTVNEALAVPELVIPDQIIDYTWGREHTFHSDDIHHIDFTFPYDTALREALVSAASEVARRGDGVRLKVGGTYGCTQGPRLETAAEIRRMRVDGCDIVGMTAMPEAALARERNIPYAGISVTVNAGAGINDQVVALEDIAAAMETGMGWVRDILRQLLVPTVSD